MKRLKGFTLVELLAVIIILGLLIAIAVPQTIKLINNSKSNSWSSSVSLVSKAIESNSNLKNSSASNKNKYKSVAELCKSTESLTTEEFSKIVNLGDITVSCEEKDDYYEFTLKGKNGYKNKQTKLGCSMDGVCYIDSIPQQDSSDTIEPIASNYPYIATGVGETDYLGDLQYENENGDYVSTRPKTMYIKTATRELCVSSSYYIETICVNFNSYNVSSITNKININGQKTIALINSLESELEKSYDDWYNSTEDFIAFAVPGGYHAHDISCRIYKDHYYCNHVEGTQCYVSKTEAYCR